MIKEYSKIISLLIGAMVVISTVSLGIKYFGQPLSREIDQKTFMNSQQYVDGSIRDLQRYQMEYLKGDEESKVIIRSGVQHQFANFPIEKVPTHLKPFYSSMMSGGDYQ